MAKRSRQQTLFDCKVVSSKWHQRQDQNECDSDDDVHVVDSQSQQVSKIAASVLGSGNFSYFTRFLYLLGAEPV